MRSLFRCCLLLALLPASLHAAETTSPTQTAEPSLPPGLYANFSTSQGDFTARLFEDQTPKTVENFVQLTRGEKEFRDPETGEMVQRRLYDNRKIFRIIKGFMFQTGSADDTNRYRSGFTIPDEIVPGLKFDRPGLLAMANTGRPDSGSCQFFVTFGPTPMLNGGYTIFGEVVEGLEALRRIEAVPVKRGSEPTPSLPIEMPVIEKVEILRLPPADAE